ncbi:MAG TPA: efflux RND transporter periplasmic adaptor subunit [Gemmataceae bacterium]|nr:efflux RND transporter periplasmic adaptor subunit [Gemmataceae bacterium]
MGSPAKSSGKFVWYCLGVTAAAVVLLGGYHYGHDLFRSSAEPPGHQSAPTSNTATPADSPDDPKAVEYVLPQKGGIVRSTTQPGSVLSYESVDLFAGVSGYLKTEFGLDIGDHIKKGQTLAVVDVPDLDKQVQHNAAVVEQARARVTQMNAKAASAQADLEATEATVKHAKALVRSKAAELDFRQKQLERMQKLAQTDSIEIKLVDESLSHRDAVREAEIAAQEAVSTAEANVKAMRAKIVAAEADIKEAEAEVKVAQAELDKAQVMVRFATVVAPFDGVITKRNFFPNDYVRAANEGGAQVPLFNVQRTDVMRVVVQVPDRDVPYCHSGNAAKFEVDALPGRRFEGKVSRVAETEDPQTRLMHVEIDIPNPTHKLFQGMYGRATIFLEQAKDAYMLPLGCLMNRTDDGKATVFVIHDDVAHAVPVRIGHDNGVQVEILGGLSADDHVILHPGRVTDGATVEAVAHGAGEDVKSPQ